MVEVIWGILNIGILIYFIFICCKATKNNSGKHRGDCGSCFCFGTFVIYGKTT